MDLCVKLAPTEDKQNLRDLLTRYLLELSRYGDVDTAYPYFGSYWDNNEPRWPYLARHGSENVGFALVNTWSPSSKGTDFAMAEFYIAPHARKSGVGCEVAKRVLTQHPGIWELSITSLNDPAKRFWPKAIKASQATGIEQIETEDEIIYRFAIR
ncbi:predicted acetyltransferase [Alloalcanivorax xenomutans]|nr:predicted acetyltransferase [Alloalcanivorax xenomutans]